MRGIITFIVFLLIGGLYAPIQAQAFSFSENEEQIENEENADATNKQKKIRSLLAVPCKQGREALNVVVMIGEKDNGRYIRRTQSNYGPLFQQVNVSLNDVGFQTYTQKEITDQIAQAEIDAFLRNDMDAAATAASRLKANLMLQGILTKTTRRNRVLNVNEVFIHINFTLVNVSGQRRTCTVSSKSASFSGADTLSVALDLIENEADLLAAELFNCHCRNYSQ
jgi:hypothetical protein